MRAFLMIVPLALVLVVRPTAADARYAPCTGTGIAFTKGAMQLGTGIGFSTP